MVADADPANPSREKAIGTIHHHGSEAITVSVVDITLRTISFMGLLSGVVSG
jgi:hypothetical protein